MLALKCDIRVEEDIINLVDQTIKKFGQIDILINNAGAMLPKSTEELNAKDFDLMMNINVRGPLLLTK